MLKDLIMNYFSFYKLLSLVSLTVAIPLNFSWSQPIVQLPDDIEAVWDVEQAYKESTLYREKICINGLWLWQPANENSARIPTSNWGYIKVPAPWPGKRGNYMWRETQRAYPHPAWKDSNLGTVNSVWYQREITLPSHWKNRRIAVTSDYVNSYAVVYVDGVSAGEMRFPGGEADITDVSSPGKKHLITLLVIAMPLKAVVQSFNDTNAAKQIRGDVSHRGLCGDVYVVSTPKDNYISDLKIETSVRKKELRLDLMLHDPQSIEGFSLQTKILDNDNIVAEFDSKELKPDRSNTNRISIRYSWMPEKLWDTHTPQNMYTMQVALIDHNTNVIDECYPVRFGFREFWIDGRDFILNGSRIFCFAVPFDNAQISADAATYESACESMLRLKSFGVNAVYTHNYGCQPGVHLGFREILKAADDVGMLVFFSQPHFSHYEWNAPDAESTNGYAQHAEFYVGQAQNHPAVVMYSMSHNATGYSEDMNPDMIDGIHEKRDTWAKRNMKRALQAEAIVRQFDQTRIIYHHASGNLGPMHISNFYLNFVPIQERSDWFEHWATEGIKPAFLCEYGVPWGLTWTLYRGWYNGKRDFGGAKIPWQFCMAEWNAQFLGDRAFQLNERDKANLRFEDRQARSNTLWHRWDYPSPIIGSYAAENDDQAAVWALYIHDNWRAFRTWGLSGFNAWSYGKFWELNPHADRKPRNLDVDWEHLQSPGFSPDFIDRRHERIDTAYERTDWIPTDAGKALINNNQPLLAYITGHQKHFSSKEHNYTPGQTIEKQIVIINNSRKTTEAICQWSLNIPKPITGDKTVNVRTGEILKIPLLFDLPQTIAPGAYTIDLSVEYDSKSIQHDSFAIHVLPITKQISTQAKIALYDPQGETQQVLEEAGISFKKINSSSTLDNYDMLIIGKKAITLDGPIPTIESVQKGLKVIVFEQSAEVLEKRLGFRVQEYGLRRVFTRIENHPMLSNLTNDLLHDWHGEATILPSRLEYTTRPMHGPTVQWCGIDVTRPWRCGCWGNVASVLLEKPTIGDFVPIVDGGFNLQYSPLLEYREGDGVIVFCQLDVTGRTVSEPAAGILVTNIIQYVSNYKPQAQKKAYYIGESAGFDYFKKAQYPITQFRGQELSHDQILIVGPKGITALSEYEDKIIPWLKTRGKMVTIGLDKANDIYLNEISLQNSTYINSYFEPYNYESAFAGIGPSDVTIRSPRQIPVIQNSNQSGNNRVLGMTSDGSIILTQLVPWHFPYDEIFHWKITNRRLSFMLTRVLGNMGVRSTTPLLKRFSQPVKTHIEPNTEKRYLQGLYLDHPKKMDDPYRFFRW
jgi:beta-galactosidase